MNSLVFNLDTSFLSEKKYNKCSHLAFLKLLCFTLELFCFLLTLFFSVLTFGFQISEM